MTLPEIHGTEHDFDFLAGAWRVHNWRLLHPLSGSGAAIEFDGSNVCRLMWSGRANVDEYAAETPTGPLRGITLRMFDETRRQWRIYWSNGARAEVDFPPMIGGFEKGHGEFYDREVFNGKPICVRFFWIVKSADACRWEQAFSADDGVTWETNWTMDFVRSSSAATR